MTPLSADTARQLIDYTYWGLDRILFRATHVPAAFYLGSSELDHGSMHKTLMHQLQAEMIWLSRLQGQPRPAPLTEAALPSLQALTERWKLEEAKMRAYAEALTDDDLAAEIEYKTGAGLELRSEVWQIIMHLVNHGTQHRSEVALAMTRTGHSPGELDFLVYVGDSRAP